jgi:hypothetical protein
MKNRTQDISFGYGYNTIHRIGSFLPPIVNSIKVKEKLTVFRKSLISAIYIIEDK